MTKSRLILPDDPRCCLQFFGRIVANVKRREKQAKETEADADIKAAKNARWVKREGDK